MFKLIPLRIVCIGKLPPSSVSFFFFHNSCSSRKVTALSSVGSKIVKKLKSSNIAFLECIKMNFLYAEVRAKRLDFGHSHLKMSWIQHTKDGVFAHTPNISPSSFSDNFHKEPNSNKISPAVLFVIVILAVIFFVSGLIHLLVRFIIKHPSSSTSSQANRHQEISTSEVLQRQLQQLFNQHDTGLDQAFIDALPVFMYKEVVLVGPKEPFDCAVCLCEFSDKDKLRLLPTCSHAFHISCIDTWLLTNSTCPLCRGALFNPGLLSESPTFDFDDSREEDGYHCNRDPVLSAAQKTIDIEENAIDKASIPVRLGKFRKLNVEEEEGEGEASSSNLDARRCYSLGSYQYVVGDFNLKVPLSNELNACNVKLAKLRERCTNLSNEGDMEGKRIGIGTKTDSYSFSKIWLWSKKGKFASTSECQMENPPPNMTLPRLEKTEGN